MAKTKFRFSIFGLFHIYRGSEVMMGSEDTLKIFFFFLKGIMSKRGQGEHVLTMANLKLKPSLFIPPPCTEFSFVNQISITRLLIIVAGYDHDSVICTGGGGASLFLYIPKGGHHFFSFDKGGGHVLLWGVLLVATSPPRNNERSLSCWAVRKDLLFWCKSLLFSKFLERGWFLTTRCTSTWSKISLWISPFW